MGRFYNGKSRRDFVFDQIIQNYYGIPLTDSSDQAPEICKDDANKKLTIGFFNQPLDHFNSTINSTWQQVLLGFKS